MIDERPKYNDKEGNERTSNSHCFQYRIRKLCATRIVYYIRAPLRRQVALRMAHGYVTFWV